jgi:hypothetical protein
MEDNFAKNADVSPASIRQIVQMLSSSDIQFLEQLTGISNLKLDLMYKATRDGFESSKFYELCSNIPNNIIIIRTRDNKIIGGYTPMSWRLGTSEYEYAQDNSNQTFLFSLTLRKKFPLKIENNYYALCYSTSWGPKWGGGHDLEIKSNCDKVPAQYSGMGGYYDLLGTTKTEFYGVESGYFIDDWEFYRII